NTITKAAVTGNPVAAMVATLQGVNVENSPQTTVLANTMNKTGSGIYCNGQNPNSTLACNTFNTCFTGINFNAVSPPVPTNVGDQIAGPTTNGFAQKNKWIAIAPGGTKMMGDIFPAIHFWWKGGGVFTPLPHLVSPASFTTGAVQSTTNNFDICATQIAPPPPGQQREQMFGSIARNQLNFPQFDAENKWVNRQYAFRSLKENPSMLTLGMPDDSVYQNFYNQYASDNIGRFTQVNDFIAANDLTNAVQANNAVAPANLIESNRKQANEIYLNSWAQGILSFTPADSAALYNIAMQEPVTGGDGVYSARVILGLDPTNSSSRMIIAEDNKQEVAQAIKVSGKIYPNPAMKGEAVLDYPVDEKDNAALEIYSIVGRKEASYQLISGTKYHQFDISNLTEGIYLYHVIVNEVNVYTNKLVIIK
ncbi:MAG: T9SS type A sorting domain-containing protein, partial [Bacteroidetes bacterium]|nr:T9SS type A sorting domain-containing protein [Bacteroidota bacterium]